MPRIRTIKPEHVTDRELPKISLQAHLLWILMWPYSDDAGVIDSDPLYLKSTLFPRRTDVRIEEINKWLAQLVNARFIVPFEYQGEGYYIHRTFSLHQRIDKPQPSKIPSDVLRGLFQDNSKNDPRTFPPVKESIVKENKGEDLSAREEEFENTVFKYFFPGKTPGMPAEHQHQKLIADFCTAKRLSGEYEEFKRQFHAFTIYQTKGDNGNFKPILKNYLGQREAINGPFTNGKWNDKDYVFEIRGQQTTRRKVIDHSKL